ncbi:MAG TPA: POTRA domain-containing protein, partial [Polyangiaceae bacterium]
MSLLLCLAARNVHAQDAGPKKTATADAGAPAANAPATTAPAATAPAATAPATPANEDVTPQPLTLSPTDAELAKGQPILRIDVVGNRRVSRDDFLAYLREHPNQPFVPENLTRDVRELWESGFFDDIQVDLDRSDEGVGLRFIVRERPNVKEITYKG